MTLKYFIVGFFVFCSLSFNISYADCNYAYIHDQQNQKLYCFDKKTNNIIDINVKKILKLDNDTFLEEINNNNNESDFALRAYFMMKFNGNTGIFLIDKNNLNDYYTINALIGEKNTNRAIAIRKYILFPTQKYFTGTKNYKKENIQLIDLVLKKTISLGDFETDFFIFKSLPNNIHTRINNCLKNQEYALYIETNNYMHVSNKLYFILNYCFERDNVGGSEWMTPIYTRLLSLDLISRKINIEKENFPEVLSCKETSDNSILFFTPNKIIKYSLLNNKSTEYEHKLNMMSENIDSDKPLIVNSLGFMNNIFYFLTCDYYTYPEKVKIYSYDFNKINLISQYSKDENLCFCGMINNNFYTISTVNKNNTTSFKIIDTLGRIKLKKILPYYPIEHEYISQYKENIICTTTINNKTTLLIINSNTGLVKWLPLQ